MEKNTVNGFTHKELALLYSFVKFYEDNIIKSKNETELFSEFPFMRDIKEFLDKMEFEYGEQSKTELNRIQIENLRDQLYYTERTSLFMGLLYHLRNSIAHALIIKEGNIVTIKDFSDTNKTSYSAKGKCKYSIIQEMINVIIQKLNIL